MPNATSTETIAIHTLGCIILWCFTAALIAATPGSYAYGSTPGQDGQSMGTGTDRVWLYTPKEAFDGASYPTLPTLSPNTQGTHANVDLGGNALKETCNFCFGVASTIGSIILLCRAASNTAINHPRTGKSSTGVAMTESVLLCFAWIADLTGIAAAGLGYEPKTGWAVFAVEMVVIFLLSMSYSNQVKMDVAEEKRMMAEETAKVAEILSPVGVPGGGTYYPPKSEPPSAA